MSTVSDVIRHSRKITTFRGILQNIDAIYDAESSLWKFTGSSEDESENDEESSNSSYES